MRVLVTGATGLLGNNVIRLLLDRGHDACALMRESSDRSPLDGLDVEIIVGEIGDDCSIHDACEGVDAIVHCAGFVKVGWTELDLARDINVGGARRVAQAAKKVGARMVHVSSVNALGLGTADAPANEETPFEGNVMCPYVATKREAELAMLEESENGLDVVIVNPGFMLGPWDWKPSSGKMLLEVASRFTPVAPRGGCSVCDVRDVADGILSALKDGATGERYILAGENIRYFELWKLMAEVTGARPPILRPGPIMPWVAGKYGDLFTRLTGVEREVNSAAVGMSSQYHYYTSGKAKRKLGYASRPIKQSIQDAWTWFQEYCPHLCDRTPKSQSGDNAGATTQAG